MISPTISLSIVLVLWITPYEVEITYIHGLSVHSLKSKSTTNNDTYSI
jgi:hypothetical protein